MTALVTKHLPLVAGAPDGIRKLRELILELAVRGKLISQEGKDEAANLLLERVAAEKDVLAKLGKIKNQKHPVKAVQTGPFELPASWLWIQLGDIAAKITDGTHHSPTNTATGDFKYISAKNIKPWGIDLSELTYVTAEVHEEIFARCDPTMGDVLYIKDGATTGVATINTMDEPFSMLSSVALIKPSCGILNAYLLKAMTAPLFYREMRAGMTGVAITRVTLAKLNEALIPLPPLAEQHRIVAKVDELMALCERLEADQADAAAAHAQLVQALLGSLTQSTDAADFRASWQHLSEHFHTLFTTEASMDALKQTVLQLAVMGKLSEQSDADMAELSRGDSYRDETRRSKAKATYPLVGTDQQAFPIPHGWQWRRLGECAEQITDGEHLTPPRVQNPHAIPLVTAKNVRDGYMDYASTDFVERSVAEKCWQRCKPDVGDILMVSVGATLGRLTVVREAREMVIVRSVALIKPSLLTADFMALTLRSPLVQKSIWASVKQSAQPCLYLKPASLLPVPVPPLAEQHRIVAKVDELMALCDQLKAQLVEARQQHAQLATALVEQAVA